MVTILNLILNLCISFQVIVITNTQLITTSSYSESSHTTILSQFNIDEINYLPYFNNQSYFIINNKLHAFLVMCPLTTCATYLQICTLPDFSCVNKLISSEPNEMSSTILRKKFVGEYLFNDEIVFPYICGNCGSYQTKLAFYNYKSNNEIRNIEIDTGTLMIFSLNYFSNKQTLVISYYSNSNDPDVFLRVCKKSNNYNDCSTNTNDLDLEPQRTAYDFDLIIFNGVSFNYNMFLITPYILSKSKKLCVHIFDVEKVTGVKKCLMGVNINDFDTAMSSNIFDFKVYDNIGYLIGLVKISFTENINYFKIKIYGDSLNTIKTELIGQVEIPDTLSDNPIKIVYLYNWIYIVSSYSPMYSYQMLQSLIMLYVEDNETTDFILYSKLTFSNYNSINSGDLKTILNLYFYEDKTNGDVNIYSSFLHTTYIKYFKLNNIPSGNDMFYSLLKNTNPINSNSYYTLDCRQDEYFSLSDKACKKCKIGYVYNKKCTTAGCTNHSKALLNNYCSDVKFMKINAMIGANNVVDNLVQCSNSQVNLNNKCVVCKDFSKVKYIDKCIDSCPEGFKEKNGICEVVDCGDNNIYNPIKNLCVSCSINFLLDIVTEECTSYCGDRQVSNFHCGCATSKIINIDPINNACQDNCKFTTNKLTSNYTYCYNPSNELIAKNGKCSKNYQINQNTGFCQKCKSTEYNYNNACYITCPNRTQVYEDTTIGLRECRDCKASDYFYNSKCLSNCPDKTFANNSTLTCVSGCDPSLPSCVPTCEMKSYFYNNITRTCEQCPTASPFIENGVCVKSCAIKAYPNILNNCIGCSDKEYLDIDSDRCVSTCPSNFTLDADNGICENCLSKKQYYDSKVGRCSKTCPLNFIWNDSVGCFLITKVIFNNTIMDECPYGMEALVDTKVCVNCTGFIFQGKCLSSCDNGYYPRNDNACVKCMEMNKYEQNDTCVDNCTSNYEQDDVLYKCNLKSSISSNSSNTTTSNNSTTDVSCGCLNGRCKSDSYSNNIGDYCSNCLCNSGYYGKLCEIDQNTFSTYMSEINNMVVLLPKVTDISNKNSDYSLNGLNDNQKIKIKTIGRYIKKVPDLLTDGIFELIEAITNDNLQILYKYVQEKKNLNSSIKKYDNHLFDYTSTLIIAYKLRDCNSTVVSNRILQSSSLTLKNLSSIKGSVDEAIRYYIQAESMDLNKKYNSTDLSLITTDSFSVYVIENTKEGYDKAKSLLLPYVDYRLCEKSLKERNVLGMNDTLYLLINVWDNQNSGSTQTRPSITNQLIKSTGESIDTKECGLVQVKMPPTKEVSSKKSIYNQMREKYGVDIFNSTDNFFHDLCISYIQQEADITLEGRRAEFNTSIVCSEKCSYSGLDDDGYIICTCDSKNVEEIANELKSSFTKGITDTNIKVIFCFSLAFNTTIMKSNIGFWLVFTITTIIIIAIIVYQKIVSKDFIKKNLKAIIFQDAKLYKKPEEDREEVKVEANQPMEEIKIQDNDNNALPLSVGIGNNKTITKYLKMQL